MAYQLPQGLLAGFYAEQIASSLAELQHAGEQWAPRDFFIAAHTHTVWEFYFQQSGETRWDAAGKTYLLAPGHFFAVPPGMRHQLHERPAAPHHFYFVALDVETLLRDSPAMRALWRHTEAVSIPQAETLAAPFRQFIREVALSLPHREEGLYLSLRYLLVEATRLLQTALPAPSPVFRHPAVLHARELLEHRAGEPWRLEDLARRVGLSPTHLAECFTREVGVPPHAYLLHRRVEQAKAWLRESNVAITAMALELGFSSGQHFAATFKRATGITPQQYRQQARMA